MLLRYQAASELIQVHAIVAGHQLDVESHRLFAPL
jgi:hypothetical protein